MPERFEVRAGEAEQRLDKLLRQRFPDLGFTQTQKLIRGGRVRVNGKRAKAADRMTAGVIITLPFQRTPATPRTHNLTSLTLYEDKALLIVNKPQGLAVQGGSHVRQHMAQMIEATDLRLVHRLDRDTSGALVLAKGALSAKHLAQAFADQAIEKTYLALVPTALHDQGTLRLPLAKVLVGGEGRMQVHPEGQEAITNFKVLGRSSGGCLLKLTPQTGRTHQLRVHCAHRFGGIFGDLKYGQAKACADSLRLHAWQVALPHPETGEALRAEAPLPDVFSKDLKRLDLYLPKIWSPL